MDMQVFPKDPLLLQTGRLTVGIEDEGIKWLILVLSLVGLLLLLLLFIAAKTVVNYIITLE